MITFFEIVLANNDREILIIDSSYYKLCCVFALFDRYVKIKFKKLIEVSYCYAQAAKNIVRVRWK